MSVHGDVDCASAPALESLLGEALTQQPRRLVLDLTDVTFMDCAGISPIARARRVLPADRPLILRSPTRQVRRLLEITGLNRCYPVESDGH